VLVAAFKGNDLRHALATYGCTLYHQIFALHIQVIRDLGIEVRNIFLFEENLPYYLFLNIRDIISFRINTLNAHRYCKKSLSCQSQPTAGLAQSASSLHSLTQFSRLCQIIGL
jgi:hypothetical protein